MFMAHKSFFYDRKDLFLGKDKELLSLSEGGQMVDRTILESGLHQINYGNDGFADEFFPKLDNSEQRDFVLNPLINHGRIYCEARRFGQRARRTLQSRRENGIS